MDPQYAYLVLAKPFLLFSRSLCIPTSNPLQFLVEKGVATAHGDALRDFSITVELPETANGRIGTQNETSSDTGRPKPGG
eukprot:scaffold2893_cov254-Pinguiococcus_pyrenoidosus.AAC.3